ncbi:guanine nucleotide-binding protein subunit gamma 3-like isoform X2 [Henckelia pumila]|uniref:guanine nucleotide-binding protein subunit gamma 3-like isoform X2 n=1 Tax=Henckelia pumila TaxID=405737 RepID=UPI003C6DCAF2
MEGLRGNGLPPPRPKSPPEYPDLYGKRRELAKIQMLEREIGFLEEELKSADGFQQASRSCKESRTMEIRRPHGFRKWLCGVSCFNVSGICTTDPEIPPCCKCPCSGLCVSCRVPKFACGSCSNTRGRLNKSKSCWNCCIPKFPSGITCSCSSVKCMYPKCPEVYLCTCYKNCCYPSYFCY